MAIKEINVPSGYGTTLGTMIRTLSFSKVKTWRPIAFILNKSENMLHGDGDIIQDLIEVQTNLNQLRFEGTEVVSSEQSLIRVIVTGKDIKLRDIHSEEIRCTNVHKYPNDILINNISNSPTELQVFFRLDSGMNTTAENRDFLSNANVSEKKINYMASNHSRVSYFKYEVKKLNRNEETLVIECDDMEAVQDALNLGLQLFEKVSC